ncbi:hypothetical protein [Xenorhabdus innexi]|uniref:Uncharacterized protein n=1 Tax=Xenorhabdus innexi TaxID=290109 RepID=A0A1N6MTT8_9GAMM|nr:hypothetical protein [Xenorhabdus innexi]PHM36869.1 hypothetical protein Xinn_01403 [Xenorhabdus innexi]SIP72231.1 exported hypothetical protein [Xenorhabdus innexi]
MRYIYSIIIIIFSISSSYANNISCPEGHDIDKGGSAIEGYIGEIKYSTSIKPSERRIIFTLSQYPDNNMTLSSKVGPFIPKGKEIIKLLVLSKLHFNKVNIKCLSGDVSTIILLDNNDPEEK